MNLRKFYELANEAGITEIPVSKMSKTQVMKLASIAASSNTFPTQETRNSGDLVKLWAEILEWHRNMCVYRCQAGKQCDVADGYQKMVTNAQIQSV